MNRLDLIDHFAVPIMLLVGLTACVSEARIQGNSEDFASPSVATASPTNIAARQAQLSAMVNPNGTSTTVTFAYFPTSNPSDTTVVTGATGLTGSTDQAVSTTINGLDPATRYGYVASAKSKEGTDTGSEQTFSTNAAPAPSQAQPSALRKAKEASEFGEYERAATLLSEVTRDPSVGETYRRDAFEYLVRAHIAQGQQDSARTAMRAWLQMAPPPVELDPNRQPPDLMKLYYEVRKEMTGEYAVRQDPGLQTLAIMDFTNASVTNSQRWASLTAGFPSMMINYLSGTTDLQVIERQRIDWLLKELRLQKKDDVVDQSTAVRTGRVLGATSVLFGTYTVLEDRIRIGARLVKVETSEILLAEEVMGDPDDFFGLVEELSKQVTRSINVELEETRTGTGPETQSIEARLAYFDGLVEMDDGNYQAARKHFEDALEHDSEYERARRKMKSLEPQLAASQR